MTGTTASGAIHSWAALAQSDSRLVAFILNPGGAKAGEDQGESHLRELIREYMAHYHAERPHQGLGGAFVQPANDRAADGPLVRRERLGGLLNYYYREAA